MKHWNGKTIQEMDQFEQLKGTALDGTFREQKTKESNEKKSSIDKVATAHWLRGHTLNHFDSWKGRRVFPEGSF